MKNTLAILCLLVISTVYLGCGGSGKPEDTVNKYLELMSEKKFEELKAISTTESAAMIDMLSQFAAMAPDKEMPKPKVEKLECKIDGDNSTCVFCCDEEGKEDEFKLKKVDGKWLMHTPKEMPNPGEMEGAIEGAGEAVEGALEDAGEAIEEAVEEAVEEK